MYIGSSSPMARRKTVWAYITFHGAKGVHSVFDRTATIIVRVSVKVFDRITGVNSGQVEPSSKFIVQWQK